MPAAQGLSDVEITRAKRRIELARATALQATRDRAMLLGEYQSKYGDAAGVNRRSAELETVTADDVRRVAATYLKRERRTILEVAQASAASRAAPAQVATAAAVGAPSERFNRAPAVKDALRVRLPESREFSLDNGVSVQVLESARVGLVTVRFDIRGAGPMYDAPERPGVALLTAVMLRAGTTDHSSREISEELDRRGAQISTGTSGDPGGIVITATGLPETFDQWFPIVADLVVRPLYRSLREARGVSVNPQSQLVTYRHGGFWLVYGDAATARAGEALDAFVQELKRLSDEPVPSDELDDAKRSLIGRVALTLEAQAQLANYMAMRKLEGLSADYWERYPAMLQAVTADDVRRAAARHMNVDRVQIVTVGDRDHLVAAMKPFGDVVYYNAEGSPLTTSK